MSAIVAASPVAMTSGGWILVLVVLVIFAGVVWGYYTKAGSDITLRPSDGLGQGDEAQAPGAQGPDSIVGTTEGEQDPFDTRGTQ